MEALKDSLRQFKKEVAFVRKVIDRDSVESDKEQFEMSLRHIATLMEMIPQKFKTSQTNSISLQKIRKEFDEMVNHYKALISQFDSHKHQQIDDMRKSYRDSTRQLKKKHVDEDEESQRQEIEMTQVNQETLFQERMIQLKEKELLEIKKKMEGALSVQQEMGRMVKQQGQQLDVCETNIDKAQENVREVEQNLIQAKKQFISGNKKKVCIFIIVTIVVLIIVVPTLLHFL